MGSDCTCEEWEPNLKAINGCIANSANHHCPLPDTYIPFRYCPWCGKQLIDEEKEESGYCRVCGNCGEDGCCSALHCAYANMVTYPHPDCDHGINYYLDIEFAYEMFHELYEKYQDEEIFDRIWDEVYGKENNE